MLTHSITIILPINITFPQIGLMDELAGWLGPEDLGDPPCPKPYIFHPHV